MSSSQHFSTEQLVYKMNVVMLCQVALRYTRKYGADKVRVLTLVKNRGKGGAVRMVRLCSVLTERSEVNFMSI